MYNQFQNGRVTLTKDNIKDIKMIDNKDETMKNFQVEALYGIQETSTLNQLFFSKKILILKPSTACNVRFFHHHFLVSV